MPLYSRSLEGFHFEGSRSDQPSPEYGMKPAHSKLQEPDHLHVSLQDAARTCGVGGLAEHVGAVAEGSL